MLFRSFPIALFIAAVAFDLMSHWTKRRALADAAYYNLLVAAISTLPVVATGILAWRYQLEGQKLEGILLLHLVLACVSTMMIWLVWWVSFHARRRAQALPSYHFPIEGLGIAVVALTGHLGGFLSGVTGPVSLLHEFSVLGESALNLESCVLLEAACRPMRILPKRKANSGNSQGVPEYFSLSRVL